MGWLVSGEARGAGNSTWRVLYTRRSLARGCESGARDPDSQSIGGRAESSGGGIELEAVREVCGGCFVVEFEANRVNFVPDSIRNGQPV